MIVGFKIDFLIVFALRLQCKDVVMKKHEIVKNRFSYLGVPLCILPPHKNTSGLGYPLVVPAVLQATAPIPNAKIARSV